MVLPIRLLAILLLLSMVLGPGEGMASTGVGYSISEERILPGGFAAGHDGEDSAATLWTGERFYWLGGHGERNRAISVFTPDSVGITKLDVALPETRSGAVAAWLGERIYVLGGSNGTRIYEDVELTRPAERGLWFDPKSGQTGTVEVELPVPPGALRSYAFTSDERTLYMLGPPTEGGSGSILAWEPGEDAFAPIDIALPFPFFGGEAVTIGSMIVVAGPQASLKGDSVLLIDMLNKTVRVEENVLPWGGRRLSGVHLVNNATHALALAGTDAFFEGTSDHRAISIELQTASFQTLNQFYPGYPISSVFLYEEVVWVFIGADQCIGRTGHLLRIDLEGPHTPRTSAPPEPVINAGVRWTDVSLDPCGSVDPDGLIVRWDWSLGDGNQSSELTPKHTYSALGRYTITLTVADEGGNTATTTADIVTEDPPPTGFADLVSTGWVVQGDASDMRERFGSIISYEWDWGDGTRGSGVAASHTYKDEGCYDVRLTVTDDDDQRTSREWIVGVPVDDGVFRQTSVGSRECHERLQAYQTGQDTGSGGQNGDSSKIPSFVLSHLGAATALALAGRRLWPAR